jgi:phosphoribosylanthranilate isomerase
MPRTRIKFCGITRVEDALAAAELGADAIGMLLHADSARKIPVELAGQIVDALPPFVTPVGLFVDAPPCAVVEAMTSLGIRHVQLQGQEPPQFLGALKNSVVIKSIRVAPGGLVDELKPWRGISSLRAIHLETGTTNQPGGSGVANDWELIRKHIDAGDFSGLPPIIAAGGLRPETVADVIRLLRPWAVDVSSGIESAPGIKSKEKMKAFVEAVRSTEG